MKIIDKGIDADDKLPPIADAVVEPIPEQVFEVGNRVQHRKTFEVRRVKELQGDILAFEPNGVTDESKNWVVLADHPDQLKPHVLQEQAATAAASHPTSASNRELANAQAYIQQTSQLKVLTRIQRDYLAEAYATVGNYELASKTTKDAVKKAEWKAVHKAIWKNDDITCKCPPLKSVEMVDGKAKQVEHSQEFTVGTIFSHKLNTFQRLVKCNECGAMQTR